MAKTYAANPADYKLMEEVGYGASATVYRAVYLPYNEVVAIKCLDLDRCNSNLDDIRREAQTMSLINHPNVIRAFCSFVVEHNLWVVMPFMAEGSCLHLIKTAYPDGFEESAIGSVLRETLKALEYLHRHGHIHRDVKAGNILVDSDGDIQLADFGVSACLFDRGDRQRSRNTFVGTPCWMAPEVLQPGTGYDFKADIWSFGITALELARGHAPFSKYPPMKVLLMTIQNAPPGLDYDRDKKFSKSFKEMVAMCLVKDQRKRPTAEKLLKHSFFRNAKPPELTVKKLFTNLPPLWKRVKDIQLKDAAQLALKKMPYADEEALSQSEYKRGVSAWNFDVEDLKLQASSMKDTDSIQEAREEGHRKHFNQKVVSESLMKPDISSEIINGKNDLEDVGDLEQWLAKSHSTTQSADYLQDKDARHLKNRIVIDGPRQTQSGPLIPGVALSHSHSGVESDERDELETHLSPDKAQEGRKAPNFSGPLKPPNRASAKNLSAPMKHSVGHLEEKLKSNLVQIRGRFSVTSENVDLVKDIPLSTVSRRNSLDSQNYGSLQSSCGDFSNVSRISPRGMRSFSVPTSILIPQLQNLLQQTSIQHNLISNMLTSFEVKNASQNGVVRPSCPVGLNGSVELPFSKREQILVRQISVLQARMNILVDELASEKLKHMQLHEPYGDGREADS